MKEVVLATEVSMSLTGRGCQLLMEMVGAKSTIIEVGGGYSFAKVDDPKGDEAELETLCQCTGLQVTHLEDEDSPLVLAENWYEGGINRESPYLIKLVREYGSTESISLYDDLKVVEIPKEVEYTIMKYDLGGEYISEKHRTWG